MVGVLRHASRGGGAAAYLWFGRIDLPLILGPAMVFSMTLAGFTGALIPIILTALARTPRSRPPSC